MFQPTALNAVPVVNVYTADYLVANLPALNDLARVPAIPVNSNQRPTTPVITRFIMYLPSRYAFLFLDSSGYTIKQVWQMLYPLLEQNQDLQNYQALINWLQVASHSMALANVQGQPAIGPPANTIHLVAPAADRDLILHRNHVLKQALPGLGQPTPGLETALFQMANAIIAQTTDQRVARETKAIKALQPILPSTKFKNTLPILLDYLQIADECNLPPLWHQWVNASKCQEFSVLRELLEAFARGPDGFYHLAPVGSAKIVQDLLTFTFIGDSQDDLKVGIQPFMVADGTEEFRRTNLELARTYGFLQDSNNGIMYAGLQALDAKEVKSMPLTYFELEKTLGMFGNLMGVTLGITHPLVTAYHAFWELLTRGMRNDLQTTLNTTGRIKPAHILRSIQLQCYSWFNYRRARLPPTTPTFVDILHNISVQSTPSAPTPLQTGPPTFRAKVLSHAFARTHL
jgi:hypothetical protein